MLIECHDFTILSQNNRKIWKLESKVSGMFKTFALLWWWNSHAYYGWKDRSKTDSETWNAEKMCAFLPSLTEEFVPSAIMIQHKNLKRAILFIARMVLCFWEWIVLILDLYHV